MTGTKQTPMPALEQLCGQVEDGAERSEVPIGAEEVTMAAETRFVRCVRFVTTHGSYIMPVLIVALIPVRGWT